MNKPLPKADLSAAFAKPSRAAGIKLPPATPPTRKPSVAHLQPTGPTSDEKGSPEEEAPQTAQNPPTAGQDDQPPAAGEEVTGKAAQPAGREATSSQTKTIVLWAPPELRKRMQTEQSATGTRYLDQILDAIETTVDRLPELVTQPGTQQVQGKLFAREITATAEKSAQRVQLTIRGFLDNQVEVIDRLVQSSGAASRSALIIAALDAALPT